MKGFLLAIAGVAGAAVIGVASFSVGLTMGSGASQSGNCGAAVSAGGSSAASAAPAANGADADVLFQAVAAKTGTSPGVQQRLMLGMLVGPWLESRWNRLASNGASYGMYSVEMPGVVHQDITIEQAEDIVYATGYMFPAYLAASQREEVQSLWAQGDFAAAAEANAYYAERPHDPYHVRQGAAMVQRAYDASIALMQKHGIVLNFSAGAASLAGQAQLTQVVRQYSNNPCRTGGTASPGQASTLVAFSGATGTPLKVLDVAAAQIGVPYAWGGGNANGPTYGQCQSGAAANDCHVKGFDCSGLTEYAYAQVGIMLPSTAGAQWQATRSRTVVPHGGDLAGAKPGDLVFFTGYTDSFDRPGHVGIYVGDGKMINAPQSGENVKITDITTPGWQNELVGITDPFGLSA